MYIFGSKYTGKVLLDPSKIEITHSNLYQSVRQQYNNEK